MGVGALRTSDDSIGVLEVWQTKTGLEYSTVRQAAWGCCASAGAQARARARWAGVDVCR